MKTYKFSIFGFPKEIDCHDITVGQLHWMREYPTWIYRAYASAYNHNGSSDASVHINNGYARIIKQGQSLYRSTILITYDLYNSIVPTITIGLGMLEDEAYLIKDAMLMIRLYHATYIIVHNMFSIDIVHDVLALESLVGTERAFTLVCERIRDHEYLQT